MLSTFWREVLPEVEVSLSYETSVDQHTAVQEHTWASRWKVILHHFKEKASECYRQWNVAFSVVLPS